MVPLYIPLIQYVRLITYISISWLKRQKYWNCYEHIFLLTLVILTPLLKGVRDEIILAENRSNNSWTGHIPFPTASHWTSPHKTLPIAVIDCIKMPNRCLCVPWEKSRFTSRCREMAVFQNSPFCAKNLRCWEIHEIQGLNQFLRVPSMAWIVSQGPWSNRRQNGFATVNNVVNAVSTLQITGICTCANAKF